jgi:hypothetical protein
MRTKDATIHFSSSDQERDRICAFRQLIGIDLRRLSMGVHSGPRLTSGNFPRLEQWQWPKGAWCLASLLGLDHRPLEMGDCPREPGNRLLVGTGNTLVPSAPQRLHVQRRPRLPRPTTLDSEGDKQEEIGTVPELSAVLRRRDNSEKRSQVGRLRIFPLTFDPQSDGNDIEQAREDPDDQSSIHPPSVAQSEFETIVRRQKTNPQGLKIMNIPSCFPSLDNDWEFAVRILDLEFLSLRHSSIGAGLGLDAVLGA